MIKQSITAPYSDKGQLAAFIAEKWTEWNNVRDPALTLWAEVDTYIHATDTTQLEGGDNWDHKTHFPVLSEIYEDLTAIMYSTIFPHDDWLDWRGYTLVPGIKTKRKKVLGYLKHIHTLNGFNEVSRKLIDDVIRYGNCFSMISFSEEGEIKEGEMISGYVGPKPGRLSPYDVVMDPTATSFEKSPTFVRDVKSIGEFKEWTDSLATVTDLKLSQEAVQQVLDRRGTGSAANSTSNTRKNQQFVPDGFGTIEQYYTSGTVEVLWFYGSIYDGDAQEVHKDKVIAVVDRDTVLFEKDIKGEKIQKGSWKKRPDNLWAQGPLEVIVGMNYMINHRENAKNDAIDKFIFPDRAYVGSVEEIYDEVTGHTKYIMPEGGSVTDVTPDGTVLTFNNEIMLHTEGMRRGARLPQQLSGFKVPGEQTRAEFLGLQDNSFRGFLNKAEQFERDVVEPLVTAEIEIARDNFSTVLKVMDTDEEGILTMLEVTEDDLKSNGKLVPYGSRRFSRLLQNQEGLQQIANTNLGQVLAKHSNTWNIAMAVEYVYGFQDFELFNKYAAIEEALEEQEVTNLAQQEAVSNASQPSVQELALQEDLDAGEDTSILE